VGPRCSSYRSRDSRFAERQPRAGHRDAQVLRATQIFFWREERGAQGQAVGTMVVAAPVTIRSCERRAAAARRPAEPERLEPAAVFGEGRGSQGAGERPKTESETGRGIARQDCCLSTFRDASFLPDPARQALTGGEAHVEPDL